MQVDRDPLTLAPVCGDVGCENIVFRVSKEVRITMIDGSMIPLYDAPGSTPVKLAFRTGIKHVPAKDARAEKRVVIVNAVEATEAPESRRVSTESEMFYCTDCLRAAPNPQLHLRGSHRHSPCASGTPPHPPVPHSESCTRAMLLVPFLSPQLDIAPHESGDCSPNSRFVRQPEGSASATSPDSPDAGTKGKRAAASPAAGAAKRTKRA